MKENKNSEQSPTNNNLIRKTYCKLAETLDHSDEMSDFPTSQTNELWDNNEYSPLTDGPRVICRLDKDDPYCDELAKKAAKRVLDIF